MTLGQVARLNVGETIELGKRCDEPLDLVVNGQIIGHGRAVTVGGKIGLRLTAVADIRQIIRALGK